MRGGPASAILTAKAPPLPGPGSSTATKKRLYKEVQENEERVKNPGRLSQALKGLGFRPGFRYEKYRTSFHLDSLHIDLDETPVGVFLELEGTPTAINRTARALGFSPKTTSAPHTGLFMPPIAAVAIANRKICCSTRKNLAKSSLFA